ncbi:uncharacterized protein LOC115628371 [Scaptodrosophila lebanonensis]|uniref:Uncharacterized protein LOC115628371 n=1 Tax=Drosophila lebanonensis TaxID=7225 RepID=A0A6J2TW08_DROLE|nr:uncharacterized protein LOC115628371 [Scaptodrosophila lebanonensis]
MSSAALLKFKIASILASSTQRFQLQRFSTGKESDVDSKKGEQDTSRSTTCPKDAINRDCFESGTNARYMEHLFSKWVKNTKSVDKSWDRYFREILNHEKVSIGEVVDLIKAARQSKTSADEPAKSVVESSPAQEQTKPQNEQQGDDQIRFNTKEQVIDKKRGAIADMVDVFKPTENASLEYSKTIVEIQNIQSTSIPIIKDPPQENAFIESVESATQIPMYQENTSPFHVPFSQISKAQTDEGNANIENVLECSQQSTIAPAIEIGNDMENITIVGNNLGPTPMTSTQVIQMLSEKVEAVCKTAACDKTLPTTNQKSYFQLVEDESQKNIVATCENSSGPSSDDGKGINAHVNKFLEEPKKVQKAAKTWNPLSAETDDSSFNINKFLKDKEQDPKVAKDGSTFKEKRGDTKARLDAGKKKIFEEELGGLQQQVKQVDAPKEEKMDEPKN